MRAPGCSYGSATMRWDWRKAARCCGQRAFSLAPASRRTKRSTACRRQECLLSDAAMLAWKLSAYSVRPGVGSRPAGAAVAKLAPSSSSGGCSTGHGSAPLVNHASASAACLYGQQGWGCAAGQLTPPLSAPRGLQVSATPTRQALQAGVLQRRGHKHGPGSGPYGSHLPRLSGRRLPGVLEGLGGGVSCRAGNARRRRRASDCRRFGHRLLGSKKKREFWTVSGPTTSASS